MSNKGFRALVDNLKLTEIDLQTNLGLIVIQINMNKRD